ncbi:hypothetical protein [Ovoidimarina sediminis]|uniref:hypothetical protein n=1 Tax=Ovoidimarina sediminis TaxID=3079856 RepID=UPI002907DBD5|nr:hypothetical protein [Rhodophyticola sp. MJ-SS7]MDU8945509.1 hypothetical protein [Rhodophyticola sp. MJ-SS7]
MTRSNLLELADRIEAALKVEDALAGDILAAIAEVDAAVDAQGKLYNLDSTDQLLSLVHLVLPGWTVSLKGKAWQPNGHWVCSLRKTSSRDSDEFIGVGRAPTVPHALLGALLRVLGQQSH